MKHEISKKVVSLLLSIAMVLTFFPAQAFADSAPTPQEAVAQAIKDSGFTATVKDSTVTVTGSVTNKNSTITIDIPDGVTVDWKATLSGDGGHNNSGVLSGQSSLLNLTGNGDFILDSSGKITCSGSTVVAIGAVGPDLTIRGQVSSGNYFAIFALLTTNITVEGGLVQSKSSNAIYLGKDGTTVTVTGGSVLSIAPEPFAITFDFSIINKHLFITGGSVKGPVDPQPTDKDGNPVYLVPVKVSNSGGVAEGTCDIWTILPNSGITYEAQTDADGYAYLWLPTGTAAITAETDSKFGYTNVAVTSANDTANITVTTPEEDVAAAITDYNTANGGTGALTPEINGSTVTVTGTLTGVTKTLKLDVPQDVKVLWKAKLTGTGDTGSSLSLNISDTNSGINSGTVEIAEGAEIINSASKAAAVVSSGGNLIMSGGKVTSTGSPGIAIAAGSGCRFLMTGGEVTANQASSYAIEGSMGTAALTGGTISASGSNGVQLLLDEEFVAYRSGMIQPGSIQCPGSQLSAAICVDQALTSTAPGSATGLTLMPYNLPDGDSLALQWVPRYDGIGINIYKKDNSHWFIVFPGVNLVVPGSTHTVFYDANGGSGTMNNAEVYDGDDYSVAANSFTRSYYSFAGWNTQADGGGTAYSDGATIADVQNDITLYAQWNAKGIPLPELKYTVSYNANGGSGAMNSAKVDLCTDYTVAPNSFTRSNYSFAGWNTQADGGGTAYSDGATIANVQNDIPLYAQWTYLGGNGSGSGKSGAAKTDSAVPAGGVPAVNNGIITTSTGTFATDTTADVHVRGGYTVRLTSDNGQKPNVFVGTPGVFEVQLVTENGNDYFVKLIPVGQPGAQAGVYLDGIKLFVATVETPVLSSAVKSDTTRPFHVKSGASYVMKLTASSRPVLVSGTKGAFNVEFVKASGNDYLFRITSTGKTGVSSGFYVNSEKSPIAVATIG